jgi:hypothetical protein
VKRGSHVFFLSRSARKRQTCLDSGPNRSDILDEILTFLGSSSFDFSISVPDFDWKGSVLTSVASESGRMGLIVGKIHLSTK